jgi:hypothetical protein
VKYELDGRPAQIQGQLPLTCRKCEGRPKVMAGELAKCRSRIVERSSIDLWLPCLNPVMGEWYPTTSAAQEGMPPHCSLLYPWRHGPATNADVALLTAVVSSFGPINLRIDSTGRFPGVLYLRPNSRGRLESLMRAVWSAFPESPPYEGIFGADPKPIPHITVLKGLDDQLDEAERAVQGRLELSPIELIVCEITISEKLSANDGRWHLRDRVSLHAKPSEE